MGLKEGAYAVKGQYEDLYGAKIKEIYHDGGSAFGTSITIILDNGRTLKIDSHLKVNDKRIVAEIHRSVGTYGVVSND